MNYDSWKLDSPPERIEETPFRREVDGCNGILAWHLFSLINAQETVSDWAWQTCQKGPFTSWVARTRFRIQVVLAQLAGERRPLVAATKKAIHYADPDYLDACSEVEETWREHLSLFSLKAIQERDYTINLYQCDFQYGED